MHLEHFKYLTEINKRHSISAAARALYMGQTTLSSIVKSVEEQLGFQIFQRAPNGVVTTENGERLMALAWEIEVKYEELFHLKDRKSSISSPIVVPLAPSVSAGACIPIMESFYQKDNNSTLIFEESSRLDIYNMIIQNTANMGVTYLRSDELAELQEAADKNKIAIKVISQDRFFLVVGKHHHLAGRSSVSMDELYDEPIAMSTRFHVNTSSKVLTDLSRNSAHLTSYPMIHMLKQAVLEQNMAAILTGYAIYHDVCCPAEKFRVLELTDIGGENLWNVCLLHRHSKNLRYPERSLLQCIEDYFTDLDIERHTLS